jgi:hypothetical protein
VYRCVQISELDCRLMLKLCAQATFEATLLVSTHVIVACNCYYQTDCDGAAAGISSSYTLRSSERRCGCSNNSSKTIEAYSGATSSTVAACKNVHCTAHGEGVRYNSSEPRTYLQNRAERQFLRNCPLLQ